MSCTKKEKVKVQCSCGGTGYQMERDPIYCSNEGPWRNKDEAYWHRERTTVGHGEPYQVSCSCGGKGYYYEYKTTVDHDWSEWKWTGVCGGTSRYCKKCGEKQYDSDH